MSTIRSFDGPRSDADDDSRTELIDIIAVLKILWRRKWLIGILTVAALAAVFAFVQRITPTFQATTTVFIDTRQAQVLDVTAVLEGMTGDVQEMEGQLQIITSRAIAQRVVDAVGLMGDPDFNPTLGQETAGPLDPIVEPVRATLGRFLPLPEPEEPAPLSEEE
ncbi:MAG: hypothetical protein GVY28_01690, partial [Alphaproteobacteria bacterium]|nr:hypothetical protein [Alphaproteobacteria bacterium]